MVIRPVHQRILGLVDAGILLRVGGEDRPEVRMNLKIPFAVLAQAGEIQDPLLQHTQQGVVGLRAGTVELVVDQGIPAGTGRGEAVVHP